ncbi:MAG: hypothetical protein JST28_14770 [Acidobacteria bacterium]|nr:hypothetical protein [Acidobacteriota bacterium]
MHRRTRRTLLVVAGVLALLAVAIFLRSKAPPEAARLLPESDGIIYFNLKPVRTFLKKDLKPPTRVPEYQEFVDATGVDWERDLDSAAIALHRMPDPNGPNGPVAYSMVLTGKLTGKRLNSWLDSHATTRELYAGHTIYDIPSENRVVRAVQVGYDMIAVSNYPTPEKIHSIVDRHRTAALPFAGSSLLSAHYSEVPLLSVAWGVGQVGLPFSESGSIKVLGLSLPLQDDSTIIASITPGLPLANSVRLRVEEIAPDEAKAASQAAALSTIVILARDVSIQLSSNPANNALREILKSTQISQKRNRVSATATLAPGLLGQITDDKNLSNSPATRTADHASD